MFGWQEEWKKMWWGLDVFSWNLPKHFLPKMLKMALYILLCKLLLLLLLLLLLFFSFSINVHVVSGFFFFIPLFPFSFSFFCFYHFSFFSFFHWFSNLACAFKIIVFFKKKKKWNVHTQFFKQINVSKKIVLSFVLFNRDIIINLY